MRPLEKRLAAKALTICVLGVVASPLVNILVDAATGTLFVGFAPGFFISNFRR